MTTKTPPATKNRAVEHAVQPLQSRYSVVKAEWVQSAIEGLERAYEGEMPVHNKEVARSMLGRDYDFWEKEAVRIDSNNSHDDM